MKSTTKGFLWGALFGLVLVYVQNGILPYQIIEYITIITAPVGLILYPLLWLSERYLDYIGSPEAGMIFVGVWHILKYTLNFGIYGYLIKLDWKKWSKNYKAAFLALLIITIALSEYILTIVL